MKEERLRIINEGYKVMSKSNLAICSIVRDCEKSLLKNIPIIEELRTKFKNSQVIIFENDSIDNTKSILKKWSEESINTIVKCDNFNKKTIPINDLNGVNKYFSEPRISKMSSYRNQYLKLLNSLKFDYDYLIVIDLDIEKIFKDGIAHSFGLIDQWDVVTANGYSYSPSLKKRYHDTYALVEIGKENQSQDENSIIANQSKWSFLKENMPLIPVYSAFGGVAIYNYNTINNKDYKVIQNKNDRVEVRCEHFSIHQQIQNEGYNRIFINPNMKVRYQSLNFSIIKKFLNEKLFKRKQDLNSLI